MLLDVEPGRLSHVGAAAAAGTVAPEFGLLTPHLAGLDLLVFDQSGLGEVAVFGATTGGVGALGSSDTGRGGAGGAVGTVSTGWLGATSVSVSACGSAALDHNVAAKATESKTL